jgi:hypothetical protein
MRRNVAKKAFALPFRQIHLDFHTGAAVPDVGAEWDAKAFARTLKAARVNSITVFAKCHHGHLYYNTKRAERHPGLKKGLDLLGEQVEALHREGIRAPIYISVQCDEYAANTYPEWIAKNADGTNVGAKPLMNPYPWFNWQIMDMNSPYQEFLAEQTREVLRLFKPVDGIFFDMCWDQPSVSKWAVAAMLKKNLNPENEADRAKHAREVALAYMARFHKMVQDATRGAGVYFNSRPLFNLDTEIAYQEQVEIESLPTGGWGYMYFPINVRFARLWGKPYLGMTARFHKSWADFGGLKPEAALEYEMLQAVSHGARCSIGDQLHPRGYLDKATYELVGRVYSKVEAVERFVADAKAVSQVGVFMVHTGKTSSTQSVSRTAEGYTRVLQQLRHQFDVVLPTTDLDRYELLILPDNVRVTKESAARLKKYLKGGGKLLVTGLSGLSSDAAELLLPELGVKPQGMSPFQTVYLRFGKEVSAGVPRTDHVMYERGVRVLPTGGTRVLAQVVEPYFDRTWEHFSSHAQTPPARVSKFPAATINRAGNVAYISFPIFDAFATHGNLPYRQLVQNVLDLLLPDPLLRASGPSGLETTVLRDGSRTILNLLYYAPERRTPTLDIVEDVIPIAKIDVSLRVEKKPKIVRLQPQDKPLNFSLEAGRVSFTLPELRGHQMITIE